MRAAHQFLTFTTPTPVQHGAVAALAASSFYDDLRVGYRAETGPSGRGLAQRRVRGPPHRGHLLHDGGYRALSDADDRSSAVTWSSGRGGRHSPSVFYHDPATATGWSGSPSARRGDAHRGRGEAGQALHRLITAGRIGLGSTLGPMPPRHILVAVGWPYASGSLHLGHLGGAYLPPISSPGTTGWRKPGAHGLRLRRPRHTYHGQGRPGGHHPPRGGRPLSPRDPRLLGAWGSRSTSSPPP